MKAAMEWNERCILIALHETTGIGWQSIDKIYRATQQDFIQCLAFTDSDWAFAGLSVRQLHAVKQSLSVVQLQRIVTAHERLGVSVLTRVDEDYPYWLKHIHEPPWVLYLIGDASLLHHPSLAVVGTRVPSSYGRHVALSLCEELSRCGLTIVSGLAKGVDALAHEGALRQIGTTIAVLGTPVDVVYPPENRSLFREIALRGLIVSEYPSGTKCHPGLFPQRNRIIAGLSRGTLVVEAAVSSGSLITSSQALHAGRHVYAIPGPIHSPKSAGTNALIRDSAAKLVVSANDILVDFLPHELHGSRGDITAAKEAHEHAALTQGERSILDLLQDGPCTTDRLQELSGMSFGHLHAVLINLSIKRKIEQHSGSLYRAL